MFKWILRSMTELTSQKWLSKITGRFAESRASKWLIPYFAKVYHIQIDEAEKAIHEYHTLNEFFTRKLKADARLIEYGESHIISPVDAKITSMGPIYEGMLLNVKGQDYRIAELLASNELAERFKNGYHYVLYLSPTDYHRIHAPVAGQIIKRQHILGKVYPVHDFGMENMKMVLSRNERLITYIQKQHQLVSVVKVGAMNVSSIRYVDQSKASTEAGEELAYFAFGSTVVLLLESNHYMPSSHIKLNDKVKMGQLLGKLKSE